MYRRGVNFFRPLLWLWGSWAYLWAPPPADRPLAPRTRMVLRVLAVTIAVVALATGGLFTVATFLEPASPGMSAKTAAQGRFWTACLTFGLFGLRTSAAACFLLAAPAAAVLGAASGRAHWFGAIVLAAGYFAQWLGLATALVRHARAPRYKK
jgi:hypothetical protein